jgi:hypothetical protein
MGYSMREEDLSRVNGTPVGLSVSGSRPDRIGVTLSDEKT